MASQSLAQRIENVLATTKHVWFVANAAKVAQDVSPSVTTNGSLTHITGIMPRRATPAATPTFEHNGQLA